MYPSHTRKSLAQAYGVEVKVIDKWIATLRKELVRQGVTARTRTYTPKQVAFLYAKWGEPKQVPNTRNKLSQAYSINPVTFDNWIRPIKPQIQQLATSQSKIMTPKMVDFIYEKLDAPNTI